MATRRQSIDQIRRFNRHYVPVMRLLDRSYLDTGMSTVETDVLIEIGERKTCAARDIARELRMDKGQLSRTVHRFEERGWVARKQSSEDGRLQLLSLTAAGRAYVDELTVAGERVVDEAFSAASDDQLAEAAAALTRVLELLGGDPA